MRGQLTYTRLMKVLTPPIKLMTVDTECGAKKLISQDEADVRDIVSPQRINIVSICLHS